MIGTILCWAGIEILGSLVYLGGGSPATLLQIRFAFASFLFFLTILLNKKLSFKIARKDWKSLGVMSLLLAAHLFFFWVGLKKIVSIVAMLGIYFTYPSLMAVTSSLLLKEKFTKARKVSLLLGTLGMLFTIGFLPKLKFGVVGGTGVIYLFLAVATWIGYLLISQKEAKKYSPPVMLFYNFLISTLLFLLLQSPIKTLSELSPAVFKYLLALGVFSTYLAYLFLQKAIKYLGATSLGIIHLSKTTFSIILAYLVLHQSATPFQLLGIALVLSSILVLSKDA